MEQPTIRLRTSVPGPESLRWMRRRNSAVPRGPINLHPVFIASGRGACLVDVDGNQLLDFAGGLGCLNVGHTDASAVAALSAQAERYLHNCFHVTPNDGYVRLAEALNDRMPCSGPKKTLLVNSGAEAVENAVKIARAFTGRHAVIAFDDAFHGRTLLAMTLTSKTHPYKAGFGPFAPEIYRIPYPYCYRCPYSLTPSTCEEVCADRIEDVFRRVVAEQSVAAVIIEPVLGEGGFVPAPPRYLARLARECQARGIVVIVDEIQTGVGRTGTFFACEQYDFEPDLLLAGKSLGSGLPIAAVTGRADVMDAPVVGGLGGTYGGNPVACEVALSVIQTYYRENLGQRSRDIGDLFARVTEEWPRRYSIVGDIRGVGAMRAIEFVRDRASKTPAPEETQRIVRLCAERGVLLLSAGTFGNVLRLLVPLTVTDAQLCEGLAVLETAVTDVLADMSSNVDAVVGDRSAKPQTELN